MKTNNDAVQELAATLEGFIATWKGGADKGDKGDDKRDDDKKDDQKETT